ncbi:MAG: hypothetical protein US43_C0004G0054 [Candidatus Levybacteria bacterium GW2011_GWA1_37_16]|nr:MAG: hypothetical protein US43_C0004G0054 [Candidatus Levybacteria bacterium GW2011_GWA1_37_16]KKQ42107.1 MAG: hypothetical protein US59_C0015G0014 [Candidatus Levybacteria bacterium GW2011_GWB1_37_8]
MTIMGNFNRDRNQSGGRNFGRRDFGGDRPMHQAICGKCNKECEVPFKPTGSRPVFCKDCFQNKRASGPMRFDNNYPRHSSLEDRGSSINRSAQLQYKEQFEALNAKLDKILRILEPKIATVVVSAEAPKVPEAKKTTRKSTSTKKKQ